jgi:two-component sensor histidine kinase
LKAFKVVDKRGASMVYDPHVSDARQENHREECYSNENFPLEEAYHRIANHLALLISYIRLKTSVLLQEDAEPTRDSVHLLLDGVCAQINTVVCLHRSLAMQGGIESVDLGDHLHGICAPFRSELSGSNIVNEHFEPGCVVSLARVLPVSQIVVEVVMNAFKYARNGGDSARILIRCFKDSTGAALVEIIDEGPGLPPNFNVETDGGLGFRLLRGLCKQLHASMTFASTGQGLHFRLRLPAES